MKKLTVLIIASLAAAAACSEARRDLTTPTSTAPTAPVVSQPRFDNLQLQGSAVDAVSKEMPLNVGGPSSSTDVYVFANAAGGKQGCDITSGTALTVSVTSSNTTIATVSPSTLTFTACGSPQTLTVTPGAQGDATVSFRVTASPSGGVFNVNPATFTVKVTPLPNTAPVVSITGVTGGTSYEIGAVPAATCQVTDAEDGNSSFAATLSTVSGPLAAYGLGEQTASCSYTDGGGLTASASVTYGIVDTTAPVITFVSRTAANGKGWNTGDVTVTWSCTDSGSGPVAGTVSQTVSAEGVGQSATGTCEDHAGNTASDTQTGINIDRTPPSANATPSPTANANGWNNSDVTVTFSGTDALSGSVTCTPQQVLSSEGANQSASGSCTDAAGNTAQAIASGINIDKTVPTASASASPGPNANGWNNTDVTVSFSGSDPSGSGIDFCDAAVVLNTDGAGQSASGTCTDKAGNASAPATASGINIDKTAPVIALSSRTQANAYGWNNTDVTVTWSCTDALSNVVDGSVSRTVSTEGLNQSAEGSCTDKAGNTASNTQTGINIDKTAPTASASASPTANANGWNMVDVTVSFSGTDALSKIASCSADVVLSSEGAGQSASGTCTDKAGNVSALATASGISIDKTAPTVSLVGGPVAGGTYYFGFVPAAPTCSASDDLSGLDGSCSASGYSSALGSHTVTANATDKAGNQGSASATYTVLAWSTNGFFQPVDMSPLAPTAIVWNTVKAGSTVPLKFEIFAGPTELTSTSYVNQPLSAVGVACSVGTADDIELVATGGTSLRYDTTAGQFIYNWQTPRILGACYKVTVGLLDGSSISAYFKLK